MAKNDYVKPPKDSVFKNAARAMKSPYSYLHPDYWKRKLIHLVLVVPTVLFIYTLIYGLTIPWKPTIIDTIIIAGVLAPITGPLTLQKCRKKI